MANKRVHPYGSAGGPPAPPEAPIQFESKKQRKVGETPCGDSFVQRYGRSALRRVINRARSSARG